MIIDNDLITYLEDLSYLTLSGDEKERLGRDLEKILSGMDLLREVDTSGISGRNKPSGSVNASREDEVTASFDRELLLKNAPVKNNEMFIAPKTVE